MLRGGAYYSTVAAQLLNAHYNDLREIQVVNVRHHGAVTGWNPEWVLEMPCKISSAGIIPLPAKPLPLICESLITSVKAYEIMTVEAAVHHSRSAAFQALLAHPLGPSADKVKNVLDDMLETNKKYLGEFH
jgi:6-phospho-beta-glucosidase